MSIASALHRLLKGLRPADAGPFTGSPYQLPDTLEERRAAARWGYRLILLREPEAREPLDFMAERPKNMRNLRDMFIQSQEARAQQGFPNVPCLRGSEPPMDVEVHVAEAERQQLFERVQAVWRKLGEERPHWSVVTADDFMPDRIHGQMENFYGSGETDVELLARMLERNHVDLRQIHTCLDFGCGVGRLSIALGKRVGEVVGVDASAPHLALAREAANDRGAGNVRFVQLDTIAALASLPAVDLVYSLIVLQHNPPPVMQAILEVLLQRLNPGGVAVFQVPTYKQVGYRFRVSEYLAEPHEDMEMHALPQNEVFASARRAGVDVLEVMEDTLANFGTGSRSNTFVMQRPRNP